MSWQSQGAGLPRVWVEDGIGTRDEQVTPDQAAGAIAANQGRGVGEQEAGTRDSINALKNSPGYSGIGGQGQFDDRIGAARTIDERNAATAAAFGGGVPGGAAVSGAGAGGGITQAGTPINSGGIAGLFGEQRDYPIYVPTAYGDSTYAGNRQQVNDMIAGISGRPSIGSPEAALAGGFNQDPQAQFRNQQLALGNALMAQANGQGPSVAGSQLQQSTEMNLQAALAQAASSRGGNLGAAQYQLGNARANIQQQAAMQLAQARIQEQMAARAQLGQVLESGRGQDLGVGQMVQQNNQFNATQQQQAGQFGAQFQAEQQAQRDQTVQQLMAMGYSLDQANYMATIQQQQFGVGSVAQQIAAANGVSVQNAAQGVQLGGALIGAAGAAATGGATAAGAYAASQAVRK